MDDAGAWTVSASPREMAPARQNPRAWDWYQPMTSLEPPTAEQIANDPESSSVAGTQPSFHPWSGALSAIAKPLRRGHARRQFFTGVDRRVDFFFAIVRNGPLRRAL